MSLKQWYIVLILSFSLFTLEGRSFNEFTFLISDFRNGVTDKATMLNHVSTPWNGIAVHLVYSQDNDEILLASDKEIIKLADFLKMMVQIVENNDTRIIPIFIDYQGPMGKLTQEINSPEIVRKLFFVNRGEKWPNVQDMLDQDKQIVIFSFQRNVASDVAVMYAWDHICEFPRSGLEDPYFDGTFANGNMQKELMLIQDIKTPQNLGAKKIGTEFNQNQYYINHILNRWRMTGKKPNFVFLDKYVLAYAQVVNWLSSYKIARGEVKNASKPLEKLFWKHSSKCITGGYFSFPYSEGEELVLTPFYPGYMFTPETVVINAENPATETIQLNAIPLAMNDGLSAYFSFDQSYDNVVRPQDKVTQYDAKIITDLERGDVAKLSNNAFIRIGSAPSYIIRNNSFTVSAWIKLPELKIEKEYSILGTNEMQFRKGIHLVIRNGRPYFGFYGNDLHSGVMIKEKEWTHIVYRYNLPNGEQAIYVNGKEAGSSLNHSSFIGDSALTIGRSMNGRNFLNGYIDDLGIWSRALGDEEIARLYRGEIRPELAKRRIKKVFFKLEYAALLILFFALLVWGIVWNSKRGKQSVKLLQVIREKESNAIFLFGDFKIINPEAQDLTSMFTPKLKELFLLLLLFSLGNKKGISTSELTQKLWPGFPPQKAANNRSVSFNKLRKIIASMPGVILSFNNAIWTIRLDNTVVCDYAEALKIMNKQHNEEIKMSAQLFALVRRGTFLQDMQCEWLDDIRGHMTNEIVDILLSYAGQLNQKDDYDLMNAISQRVLSVDDLNEKALHLKLALLVGRGNKNQAKFSFEQFCKKYYQAYHQTYPFSFSDFINTPPNRF